mgnify:CR=1 FL=1
MEIRRSYGDFVQGNTVRKEASARPYVQPEEHRRVRRKRVQVRRLSLPVFFSVCLAVASFVLCAYMMVTYVTLRSRLNEMSTSVTSKRSQLSTMASRNDAEYNRIMASVDLNAVEAIARGELGMTYADEGQIVFYSGEAGDYMRRYGN